MRCPRAVITSFATNLREKAIEIEEYIEETGKPLQIKQEKRLQRMTTSMEDRCHRMRAAWQEHDPNVHRKDAEFLEELNEVVRSVEAEVAETSREAYRTLQLTDEECLRAEKPRAENSGEKLARQVPDIAKQELPTWTAEPTPKGGLASPRTAEYHDEPDNRAWKRFEEDNNALNSRRQTKEITRRINPSGETGCRHCKQRASGQNNTDDESAEEPVE